MPRRKDLIAWQWSSYDAYHARRANLAIHIFAVPMFVGGVLGALASVVRLDAVGAVSSVVVSVVGFALQAIGHKREPNPPIGFDGPVDVVTRIFTEQLVTFPRFVLTGGWWRAWRRADAADRT